MKKFLLPAIVLGAIIFTSSCGSSGFTDDQRKSFKELCMIGKMLSFDSATASKQCDCYVEKLEKAHPDGGTPDDRMKLMEEGCGDNPQPKKDDIIPIDDNHTDDGDSMNRAK